MVQPAMSESNVLTTRDDRIPTAFHWQLTLLATLGGFLFGHHTSNIGSALNFVPYNLHGLAQGYLVFSGAHATLVQTTVAGVEVTAIMTAVNVASTYLGFRWIDKFGRRKLSMSGFAGMIAFALVAAAGLTLTHGTFRLVVIMVGLDFFIASFAIGVGGTGWMLQGEVFPTAVRGQAAAFCAMIDWLANFALIEVFPVSQNAISLSGVLVVFAGLCALAIVFVWKFVPETKNLPVEEIIGLFEHKQTTLPEAA